MRVSRAVERIEGHPSFQDSVDGSLFLSDQAVL